mgnify:CR=1 FL=1
MPAIERESVSIGSVAATATDLGHDALCVITYASKLSCAGNNEWGQLGYEESTSTPTAVTGGITWHL